MNDWNGGNLSIYHYGGQFSKWDNMLQDSIKEVVRALLLSSVKVRHTKHYPDGVFNMKGEKEAKISLITGSIIQYWKR